MSESSEPPEITLPTLDIADLHQTYVAKVAEKGKVQARALKQESAAVAEKILEWIVFRARGGDGGALEWSSKYTYVTPSNILIPRVIELLQEAKCPAAAIHTVHDSSGEPAALRISPFWAE